MRIFYPVADWSFWFIDELKDVSGNAFEDRSIGWCVVFSRPAVVFVQLHIKHPMQVVFDFPVAFGNYQQLVCFKLQRRDEVACYRWRMVP